MTPDQLATIKATQVKAQNDEFDKHVEHIIKHCIEFNVPPHEAIVVLVIALGGVLAAADISPATVEKILSRVRTVYLENGGGR